MKKYSVYLFTGWPPLPRSLVIHLVTKEAAILGSDKKIKIEKSSFIDELPSRGVAIYTTLK